MNTNMDKENKYKLGTLTYMGLLKPTYNIIDNGERKTPSLCQLQEKIRKFMEELGIKNVNSFI